MICRFFFAEMKQGRVLDNCRRVKKAFSLPSPDTGIAKGQELLYRNDEADLPRGDRVFWQRSHFQTFFP